MVNIFLNLLNYNMFTNVGSGLASIKGIDVPEYNNVLTVLRAAAAAAGCDRWLLIDH